MADPIHGLTTRAANQVGQVVRKVLRTLPETGRRTRRVVGNSNGNANGGGVTGSTGCCCNCTDCVKPASAAISDCVACPSGATTQYKVTFVSGEGGSIAARTISDIFDLTWVSGCTWLSDPFYVTVGGVTGRYIWVLLQNGDDSTITLEWYDGGDPLDLTAYSPCLIRYVYNGGQTWSCRCQNQMVLDDRECLPVGSGLACSICVIPLVDGGCSGAACTDSTCVTADVYWTMPFVIDEGDGCRHDLTVNLCCAATCVWEAGPASCGGVRATLDGDTGTLNIAATCPGLGSGAEFAAVALYSVPIMSACPLETPITATFVSGDAGVTWPATLTLTPHDADGRTQSCIQASDCCDGDCYWVVVVSGFGGPKVWGQDGDPSGTCVISDCTCPEPDTDPTTLGVGETATTRCGGGSGDGCTDTCTWVGVDSGGGVIVWSRIGGTGIDGCYSCGGCNEPDHTPSLGETASTGCIDA